MNMFVRCPSCGEEHFTEDKQIKILDCHEGQQGEDVITYKCPTTSEEVEAIVLRGR